VPAIASPLDHLTEAHRFKQYELIKQYGFEGINYMANMGIYPLAAFCSTATSLVSQAKSQITAAAIPVRQSRR
jgi:hypothetical protein